MLSGGIWGRNRGGADLLAKRLAIVGQTAAVVAKGPSDAFEFAGVVSSNAAIGTQCVGNSTLPAL